MKFKNFFKLITIWRIFTILFYIFVIYFLINLSNRVSFEQVKPANESKIEFNLDFCYKLTIRDETCEPSNKNISVIKNEFPNDCKFNQPIECYTKGFRDKTIGEILKLFKNCNISNLITIDRPSDISYKLYFGHICVKHKFIIDFKNGDEKINIYPQQKHQIFLISVSSKRYYKDEDVYRSPIVNIFRRFCWLDPFPPKQGVKTKYHCSEDGKHIDFKLDYFSVKSLEAPFRTQCTKRKEGDESNQRKCYENCVKRKKSHIFMTYRDESSKLKFAFDNYTVMKPLVEKCLIECSNIDCNYGSFDVSNIINNNGNDTISLLITSKDHRTQVMPFRSKLNLSYYGILFAYLFFGLNIYEHLFKKILLRNYFNTLKLKKKREKQSYKLVGYSLITLIIGLIIGFLCEAFLFEFGIKNQEVVIKRESTFEINVSVSICFNLSTILKDNSKNLTDNQLMNLPLKEIDELTWSVSDFKKRGSMRNSVGPVPIRHDEKEIFVFIREFKKCFLIYYETEQLFPHIYLQRKSHIFFNVTDTEFSYFYVENNFKYPQLNSPKFENSSLFTLNLNDFRNDKCEFYNLNTGNCSCKDECIQNCILEKFALNSELPSKINIKDKDHFNKYGNFKFNHDELAFNRSLAECESKYPKIECDSVNITVRPKYIKRDDHHISINLTPNTMVYKDLKNEDKLVVFNRILGFLIILTGFSIREFFNDLLSIYLIFLPPLLNLRLTRRAVNLIIFILFSIHFFFLFFHIIEHDMLQISYKNFLEKIDLPKIRLCYETDIDLNYNNYTKVDLDRATLPIDKFIDHIKYLDKDFNTINVKLNGSESDVFSTQIFYLDELKCFSISTKESVPVSSANILRIDQLVTIFINLEQVKNKRFLVYLNVENTIDLEWSTFLHNNQFYNLYFSTKEFWYSDDYYYLKNFKALFRKIFDLKEESNTQKNYFHYLRKNYNDEQYVTTTILPLFEDNNLQIKNQQFNAFMHFRSIDGNKNYWDFTHNSEIPRFSYDIYKENPEFINPESVNKSIVSLRPNLSCLKNIISNKYHIIEFLFHLFILSSFWLKFNLFNLPKQLVQAYPVAKFFVNLFLYVVVCILIFIFDVCFKFFSFFK